MVMRMKSTRYRRFKCVLRGGHSWRYIYYRSVRECLGCDYQQELVSYT